MSVYKFEVTVEVDPEMGFDTAEIVQGIIEEVIHDTIPAGITIKMESVEDFS